MNVIVQSDVTPSFRQGPEPGPDARFGAVSFVQRFGSALNAHLYCCVTDGVFSLDPAGTLHFHTAADLDAAMVSAAQRRIRSRVLRLAVRQGALTPEVAADPAPFRRLDHRTQATFASRAQPKHPHSRPSLDTN